MKQLKKLQLEISKYPQPEFDTRHYFADGMYCRELPRPKGALIVGKVHKKEHFYIVASGDVTVYCDGDTTRIVGPKVMVYPVGSQRAVYAHTDATCITVHRCEKKDIEAVEAELVEEDSDSMYLPGNIVKPMVLK